MTTLNTNNPVSAARTRFELEEAERKKKNLLNTLIRRRREGASPDELEGLRQQIAGNREQGQALSLENSENRQESLARNEVQPRDIPSDEIRKAATLARLRGETASRLSAEQGAQAQRQDSQALADVQLQAEAQRRGLTVEQVRELNRLSTPITPGSLAAQSDRATAQTINRQGGADPQAVLDARLGDSPEAGEARIGALREQLAGQETPELSGRPTDPRRAREFSIGKRAFEAEQSGINSEVDRIRARQAIQQAETRRTREDELGAAQHQARLASLQGPSVELDPAVAALLDELQQATGETGDKSGLVDRLRQAFRNQTAGRVNRAAIGGANAGLGISDFAAEQFKTLPPEMQGEVLQAIDEITANTRERTNEAGARAAVGIIARLPEPARSIALSMLGIN